MGLHQIGLDTGIEKSIENNASKNVVGGGFNFHLPFLQPPPLPFLENGNRNSFKYHTCRQKITKLIVL